MMFHCKSLPNGFASALFALTPLAAQAPVPAQDSFFDPSAIGFTDDCYPNPALQRVLGMMGGANDDPDIALYNAISGEMDRSIMFDQPIAWNGLHIVLVRQFSGIERGPNNYYLQFAETPGVALAALNAIGMNLPAVDETRDVPELEGYASIGLMRLGPDAVGSQLVCFRD